MGIPSFSINRKRLFLMSGSCRFDPRSSLSRTVPFRSLPLCFFSRLFASFSALFRILPRFFCVLYAVIHGLHPLTLGIHFISRSRESPPVSVLLCGNSLRGTWESPPFRMLFGVCFSFSDPVCLAVVCTHSPFFRCFEETQQDLTKTLVFVGPGKVAQRRSVRVRRSRHVVCLSICFLHPYYITAWALCQHKNAIYGKIIS